MHVADAFGFQELLSGQTGPVNLLKIQHHPVGIAQCENAVWHTLAKANVHANTRAPGINNPALVRLHTGKRAEVLRDGRTGQRPEQRNAKDDPAHGLKFSRDRLERTLYQPRGFVNASDLFGDRTLFEHEATQPVQPVLNVSRCARIGKPQGGMAPLRVEVQPRRHGNSGLFQNL